MAFERIEPMGALHLEYMAGQICATVANVNRDPSRKREAWAPEDFMPALAHTMEVARKTEQPIYLDDPEAMSALIKERCFGIRAAHA